MSDYRLAFIGAGNIARAIMGGLIESGFDAARVTASDPSEDQLVGLPEGVHTTTDNIQAVSNADVVMFCVKPGLIGTVAENLAGHSAGKLFVSVAAGITTEYMQARLDPGTAVIRCMPNTPALVKAGMTGLFATPQVTDEQRSAAEEILGAVGNVLWVRTEDELNAVTAVSGSGPAYFFLVMESMIDAGVQLGLEPETSRALVEQTALGAALMVQSQPEDAAQLRKNVTSPNGTTEAAINSLLGSGLPDAFEKALTAAHQRSIELSG